MNIRIFVLSLSCLLTYALAGGEEREKMTLFSVNDGLSQYSVTSIAQDSRNMLWVGTFDGLNRFDGKEFKTFRHVWDDDSSIINNRIIAIHNDEKEGLWILFANSYIGRYMGDGTFSCRPLPENESDLGNSIRKLNIIDGYAVITGVDSEMIYMKVTDSADTEEFRAFNGLARDIAQKGGHIISVDRDGERIWGSSTEGIFCIDEGNAVMTDRTLKGFNLKCCDDGTIAVWSGTDLRICKPSYTTPGKPKLNEIYCLISPSYINTVCSGADSFIWIGTLTGLYKYGHQQFTRVSPNVRVRSLYCDNMGVIWCAGGTLGLLCINPYTQPVRNFKFSSSDYSSSNHVNTVCLSPDESEVLVGTRDNGLERMDVIRDADGSRNLRHSGELLSGRNISIILPVSRDSLLVGAGSDLMLLDCGRGRTKEVRAMDKGNRQSFFKGAIVDGNAILCCGKKLFILRDVRNSDLKLEEMEAVNEQINSRSILTAIEKDPCDNAIWVGTRGDGLFKVNLDSLTVQRLNDIPVLSLRSPYIWDIFFDSKSRMWIGTDSGLHMYSSTGPEPVFKSLSSDDGLINDKIETIEEDSSGSIWAGTSQGIICYNPETGTYKTYRHEDGFQSNNFTSASLSFADGELVFGGINGISMFNPDMFVSAPSSPSLHINEITVGGTVIPEDRWGGLRILNTESTIRIELCSFYSPDPTKIKYRYSLNGNEWNVTTDNVIYLGNLKPGRYSLSLQSYVDSYTSSDITTLPFRIVRRKMLSTAAMVCYLLVLALLLYGLLQTILSKKILRSKLVAEESLRKATEKMTAEKLDHFANMAQEIKTPLTLIIGRIFDIEKSDEATPFIIRKAKLIEDNAMIIKGLTDQKLDFKKALTGDLEIKARQTDIVLDISKTVENFSDYASNRGISLKLESSSLQIIKCIDTKRLSDILYSLLSNAIKLSDTGDSIQIKVVDKPDNLVITVLGSGQYIHESEVPRMFDRISKSPGSEIGLAYTKSLVELMGGTIVASSTKVSGTAVIITIPDKKQDEGQVNDADSRQMTEVSAPAMHLSRSSVLLVEDNEELNMYITEILSVQFSVLSAADSKGAYSILQNQTVDIIVIDMMMDGDKGVDFARKVKSSASYAHIPIIILSGNDNSEDQIEGLKTGAVDYIAKPFNPHVLLMKVQNILDQYYLSKQNLGNPEIRGKVRVSAMNRDEAFINRVREIIYKNLSNEDFGVSSISQEMGISRVHLTRECNRIISQSPSDFLKKIRLNYAKDLLQNSNKTIKEVLWEIGISSHSGFTRAFKEEFGYPPSQVKKEIKT